MIRKYLLRRRPHKIAAPKPMGLTPEQKEFYREGFEHFGGMKMLLDREVHHTCERCGHVTIVPRE